MAVKATGLISPLTHYVLDAALHQCHRWRQAGQELAVAVNISARSLLDLAFPDPLSYPAGAVSAARVH